MAAQAAADSIEPAFGLGDRLEKARRHCGIKSAEDMAARLTEKLGDRLQRPISKAAVGAWEAGTNQPTMIRVEELIPVWVEVCNEAGAALGHTVSVGFIYGITIGSFRPDLTALPDPTDSPTLFNEDLSEIDHYGRPFLTTV